MVRIANASIVTAFNEKTVGTKVTNKEEFEKVAIQAIEKYDFAAQRVPGQGFIPCNDLAGCLSAGVGKRTKNSDDYVSRLYRGKVELFLRRKHAAKVEGVALIVYTREAYLSDPDTASDKEEVAYVEASDATHFLVAVLGFAGPKAPLSPDRLIHNLAGGNKEALEWSAEEIRAKALETKTYHDEWCVVAD